MFDHHSDLQLAKCTLIPNKRLETTHGLESVYMSHTKSDSLIAPCTLVFKFNPVPRLHPLCSPPTLLVSLLLLGVKHTVVSSFQLADW